MCKMICTYCIGQCPKTIWSDTFIQGLFCQAQPMPQLNLKLGCVGLNFVYSSNNLPTQPASMVVKELKISRTCFLTFLGIKPINNLKIWKTPSVSEYLNKRQPKWKKTSIEDNLNGRQPLSKMTAMEYDLNERQPKQRTSSKKDYLNG